MTLLLFAATSAAGQQWYQHYERGLDAAEEGRWQEALELFEEAEGRQGEPRERVRTYGNRFLFGYDPAFQKARCLIALGRLDEAEDEIERSATAGVTDPEELETLRSSLEAVSAPPEEAKESPPAKPPRSPEPAHLTLTSEPSDAIVAIDGRQVGRTPLQELELLPRRHLVTASREGFETWRFEVQPAEGERIERHVSLVPAPSGADDEASPQGEAGVVGVAAPEEMERIPSLPDRNDDPASRSREKAEEERDSGPSTESTSPAPASGARPSPAKAQVRVDPSRTGLEKSSRLPLLVGLAVFFLLAALVFSSRRRKKPKSLRSATGWRHLPSRIGGYELVDELGRGGMATTWRARRCADRREVALKIPHDTGDPTYVERFVREGRLGESLHHPRIVRIHEVGQDHGIPFLAMELLPGQTLRQLLENERDSLGIDPILEIVGDVAEALDYAHHKGIVHRDMKPENIMILPDRSAKVMDFGVARIEGLPGLTTSKAFFGSPLYAAPESMMDPKEVDLRADLYSLGIVLFELLEGHPPFVDESVFRVLEMQRSEPLPSFTSPMVERVPELGEIVRRLCSKEREARFPSAEGLLVEIRKIAIDPGRSRASAPEEAPGGPRTSGSLPSSRG